jgi:nitrogen regulatory protein P-II 1
MMAMTTLNGGMSVAASAPTPAEDAMKKIEAIIKPFKLDQVRQSLGALDAKGLTVLEVLRCGLHPGEAFRSPGVADSAPKVKIEVITEDERAEAIARAIERAAHTGRDGDGVISILQVDDVVRIRTGEHGVVAL